MRSNALRGEKFVMYTRRKDQRTVIEVLDGHHAGEIIEGDIARFDVPIDIEMFIDGWAIFDTDGAIVKLDGDDELQVTAQ